MGAEKNKKVSIKNLELNTNKLDVLECAYILSAVPIENHLENNLEFINQFTNEEAYFDVFLYKKQTNKQFN